MLSLLVLGTLTHFGECQRGYRRESSAPVPDGEDEEDAGTVSWRKRGGARAPAEAAGDVTRQFEASDAEEDDSFYGSANDEERVSARDMKDNSATDEYGREWNSPYETSDVTMAVLVVIGLAFIVVPIWMSYSRASTKKKKPSPSEILKKKQSAK